MKYHYSKTMRARRVGYDSIMSLCADNEVAEWVKLNSRAQAGDIQEIGSLVRGQH